MLGQAARPKKRLHRHSRPRLSIHNSIAIDWNIMRHCWKCERFNTNFAIRRDVNVLEFCIVSASSSFTVHCIARAPTIAAAVRSAALVELTTHVKASSYFCAAFLRCSMKNGNEVGMQFNSKGNIITDAQIYM